MPPDPCPGILARQARTIRRGKPAWDAALSTWEFAFAALKEFAKLTNILFGSDYLVPEIVVQAEGRVRPTSKIMDAKLQKGHRS